MKDNRLESLAESVMLGEDDARDHSDGANRIISNIIMIENFVESTDADEWESDDIGSVVFSDLDEGRSANPADSEKRIISASPRADGGFVVIPRVV